MEAQLDLDFHHDGSRTIVYARRQDPPLRVIRAFPNSSGQAFVHLHNVSGGILGGDVLNLNVVLGPGAQGQITTTGATRLYRTTRQRGRTVNGVSISVGTGAFLELLPDPVIPFSGSNCLQKLSVDLDDDATFFSWETIWPGREASGEVFDYDALGWQTSISGCGSPIARENSDLRPRQKAMDSAIRMGPYRYLATFYACSTGRSRTCWHNLEEQLAPIAAELSQQPGQAFWGVSMLAEHGLSVRGLAASNAQISHGLNLFWKAARRLITGAEAIRPRKSF